MATATKKEVPVNVKVVPAGTPTKSAHIELDTGLTGNRKYLVTIRPKKGRPVLIAVHL